MVSMNISIFFFQSPFENSDKAEQKEVLGDKYKLMRENADLKRKDRLNSQKKISSL